LAAMHGINTLNFGKIILMLNLEKRVVEAYEI